jgi:hypothetical protein
MLKGKKTYLVGGAIFVVGGLMAVKVIPHDLGVQIITLLSGLGAMALRSAVSKK